MSGLFIRWQARTRRKEQRDRRVREVKKLLSIKSRGTREKPSLKKGTPHKRKHGRQSSKRVKYLGLLRTLEEKKR